MIQGVTKVCVPFNDETITLAINTAISDTKVCVPFNDETITLAINTAISDTFHDANEGTSYEHELSALM